MGVTAAMTPEMALEYILDGLISVALATIEEVCIAREPVAKAARMETNDAKGNISTS